MNVFEALRQGNGSINETNVTGFLSYLLDTPSDIRKSFVVLFLESIKGMMEFLEIPSKSHKERVEYFFINYDLNIQPEYRIKIENLDKKQNKTVVPDILIEIRTKNDRVKCYVIVENKIKKESVKENQLVEQYEAFQKIEDYESKAPIFSLLLTINHKSFEKMYKKIIEVNNKSTWMFWTANNDDGEVSIEKIIKEILTLDINMEIHPINDIIKYLLKSFVLFLKTLEDISVSNGERENCNCTDIVEFAEIKILEPHDSEIFNKNIYIKRTKKGSILLCGKDGKTFSTNVRKELRNIIKFKNLDNIEIYDKKGVEKTTRVLGKEIIKELNNVF